MFRVGQKVVCVDASPTQLGLRVPLVLDRIYTIVEIDDSPGPLAFRLEGVSGNGELSGLFFASRFRPVVERKTDISIFIAMLNPAKKKRRADRPVTVS